MQRRVYLIERNKTYFGHPSMKRSTVFAFKTRDQVEWLCDHISGSADAVSEICENRYRVKTRFDAEAANAGVSILERCFGGVLSRCRAADITIGVVDTIIEREDGDIEIALHPSKMSRGSDVNLVKSGLEALFEQ